MKPETAGDRLGPHVEELRQFLASRGVPFGRPDDLPGFAQRIATPNALEEEMASLLRAISYTEGERLGRVELLQLLTITVGGAEAATAVEGMPGVLRPLFAFVSAALRPQRFWAAEVPLAEPFVAEPSEAEPFVAEPFVAEPSVAKSFAAEPSGEISTSHSGSRNGRADKPEELPVAAPEIPPKAPVPGNSSQLPLRPERPPAGDSVYLRAETLAAAGNASFDPVPEQGGDPIAIGEPAKTATTTAHPPAASPDPLTVPPQEDSAIWARFRAFRPAGEPAASSPGETVPDFDPVAGAIPAADPAPVQALDPARMPVPVLSPRPRPGRAARRRPLEEPLAAAATSPPPQAMARASRATPLGQRWIFPAIVAGLAILGGGAYLVKPVAPRSIEAHSVPPGGEPTASASATGACVGPMTAETSRAALEERSRWAHRLLDGKLYEVALPELQEIARLDPGFPGVNLDESDALLHLKRLDEAQVASDAQTGISECLARLPSTSLESYCRAQYATGSTGGCRPQLAHLREAAQLQSALVHLAVDGWTGATPARVEASRGRGDARHTRVSRQAKRPPSR